MLVVVLGRNRNTKGSETHCAFTLGIHNKQAYYSRNIFDITIMI